MVVRRPRVDVVRYIRAAVAIAVGFACLTACASSAPPVKRVALLAPFEGMYREIGYDALYPVKLALADQRVPGVQLISVDAPDIATAVVHASALAADPTVLLVLAAGAAPTDPQVLDALGDLPVVVVGHWNALPGERVSVLTSPEMPARLSSTESDVYAAASVPEALGGDTFGLKAFPRLAAETAGIVVLTSAAPPSAEFRQRLIDSDLFVPEPGLLATLAYDAGTLAAQALAVSSTRADTLAFVRASGIDGINGVVRFGTDGYWADAPVNTYMYDGGSLTLAEQAEGP